MILPAGTATGSAEPFPQGLAIDGIFGPKTEAAVKGFQEGLGVQQDGFVSDQIWEAMVSGMLPG